MESSALPGNCRGVAMGTWARTAALARQRGEMKLIKVGNKRGDRERDFFPPGIPECSVLSSRRLRRVCQHGVHPSGCPPVCPALNRRGKQYQQQGGVLRLPPDVMPGRQLQSL